MQKVLLLFSFITSSLFSMELVQKPNKIRIDSSSMFVPNQLGDLELYRGKKGFCVYKDDQKHHIKKYFTDSIVRDMTKKQLISFLKQGYLTVNQMDDGEYSLKAKMRLNGGGPILGAAAYWTTKCICYGVIGAGLVASIGGAGIVIKGGVVTSSTKERIINGAQEVALEGAKMGLAGIAATATVPLAMSSSATVPSGSLLALMSGPKIVGTIAMGAGHYSASGIVSAAIAGTGYAPQAALLSSAGMASTAGTSLGVVGSIEALSLTIGAFFGMVPTP